MEGVDTSVGSIDAVIPSAAAFALQVLQGTREALQIAIMGLAALTMEEEPVGASSSLLEGALKQDVIGEARMFRLYGVNFLPPRECLQLTIRPYLQGISGNKEECERILDEADIPLAHRGNPLGELSREEKQRIVSALVPRVRVEVLTSLVGRNFEIVSENQEGALRWASSVWSLMRTAWAEQREGVALAVWMGDRARSLRSLMDLHIRHSTEVIEAMDNASRAINEGEIAVEGPAAAVRVHDTKTSVLADVGEILITDTLSQHDSVILSSEHGVSVTWKRGIASLQQAMRVMQSAGLTPTSTSSTSVVLPANTDRSLIVESLKAMGANSE